MNIQYYHKYPIKTSHGVVKGVIFLKNPYYHKYPINVFNMIKS